MKFRAALYFQTSALLLLGVGFLALAATGKIDLPSILGFTAAYLTYFYRSWKNLPELLSPQRTALFSKIYIVVFLLDMLWLSHSFVTAAIHLLIFIQILKFLSDKKDKDYFYLILLAFMELLAAAAMTISAWFLIAFLVFLGLVISTLVSFEIKRSQEKVARREMERAKEFPRPQRATSNGASGFSGTLAAVSGILMAGIIGAASLIFFALPRVEGGFFSRLNSPTQSITGFSSTVHFGDVASIQKSMATVMRVQVEGDPRILRGIKWRGIALDRFEGNTWYRTLGAGERRLARGASGVYSVPPDVVAPPHQIVQYHVVLEPLSTDVLFAASRARTIFAQARIRVDPAFSLATEYHPNARLRYDVTSDIGVPSPSALRNATGPTPSEIQRSYLQLPQLDDRIAPLTRQVTAREHNAYDRAKSVEQYLRENYAYTLNLPPVDSPDPIATFLFQTRRGHCEYFAASMVLMLRTLDIPSRLINGFQTGDYNAVGKDYIIREADAHSWVEAYFPGIGWVEFDPTPSTATPQPALAFLNHYLDALELFWINWVVGYDTFHQEVLFQDVQHRAISAHRWALRSWENFTRKLSNWMRGFLLTSHVPWKQPRWIEKIGRVTRVVLSSVAAILLIVSGFRYWRRRRRRLAPLPNMVAEEFLIWLKALARKGHVKSPGQTPREFCDSIADPAIGGLARQITDAYNHLRFSPAGLGPASFQSFQTQLRWAVKQIR
ncbi:MAG: DUF3488 and transglutaminase-like domain-containing protein [Acidobacteriia bacterium]|nr:DUF3488 and transglutaminase-like domain-containing protein [Terriglobia bacterium]